MPVFCRTVPDECGPLLSADGQRARSQARAANREDAAPANHTVFIGVIDVINPAIETPEQVRDRVLEAAAILPVAQLGTCDDCGFSPFADDTSTARDTAFSKIRARVEGTALAARQLGV